MSAAACTGRIACIGEAMVELSLGQGNGDQPARLGYAGDTLNTAIYLKRLLGESGKVSFVTVLGQDPLSRRMIDFIESESIDASSIVHHPHRLPGLYAISTDPEGERTFSYWRSESAARTLFCPADQPDFSMLAGFEVLYLSAITLAILPNDVRQALLGALQEYRNSQGKTVVFDSNYRPALWESEATAREVVSTAWRLTDIALPSVDDEQALFGDESEAAVVDRLRSYGITRGALKRGALGPRSLNPSQMHVEHSHTEPAPQVVDTTAAGDSFNAGYLSAMLSGASDDDALLAGHRCAARVIGHAGAIIPRHLW